MPTPNLRSHLALRLVLFAALPALLLSALLVPRPASADEPTTVWSATLRVGSWVQETNFGCDTDSARGDATVTCSTHLTDDDFTYEGTTYEVRGAYRVEGDGITPVFYIGLDQVIPAEMRNSLRLIVNGKPYHLATSRVGFSRATGDTAFWANHGHDWSAGDRIRWKLVERDFPTLTAQPFDHSVDPLPASERRPTRSTEGVAEQYCYTGDGNPGIERDGGGQGNRTTGTTVIRYPDGRTAEVPNPGATVRTMFACN